jgi:hypothetical protein
MTSVRSAICAKEQASLAETHRQLKERVFGAVEGRR